MTRKNLISRMLICISFVAIAISANASMYSRRQARNTIEQTSYIINQAYEIATYYSYWQTNNVSRAMYYNNYAQDLYFFRNYRSAIRYSLLAREYALDVIDNCDDYWEYFYYTFFGWSFRYGYNYNFAYRNGYMDGYYDGYYARYCYRHQHDYRHDPHHNMHNDWYNDQRYNDVMSGTYFARNNGDNPIGRGDTGRIGTSSSNNNSGSTVSRPGYTGEPETGDVKRGYSNITSSNYFSDAEAAMLKDIPSTAAMENEFKRKNPTVSFSDENLSKNTDVIKRNTESASAFSSKGSNIAAKSRTNLQKPSSLTLENGQTISGRSSEIQLNKDNKSENTNSVVTPSNNNTTIQRNTSTRTDNNISTSASVERNTPQTATPNRNVQRTTVSKPQTTTTRSTNTVNRTTNNNSKTTNSSTVRTNSNTKTSSSPNRTINSNNRNSSSNNTKSTSNNNSSTIRRANR